MVALAYLIGSVPSAYIYTRLLAGRDIRAVGSGSVGGMNALRNVGVLPGVLTAITDAGKGVLAAWLASRWFPEQPLTIGLSAIAAVAGHNWMAWLRFRGGKGLGAMAGGLMVIQPWALAGVVGVYAVVILLFRDAYASVVISVASLPAWMWGLSGNPVWGLVGLGVAAVVIAKHVREFIGFLRGRREIL
jgi:glycerol-3-phosphate acyltransferase PlsY